MRVYELSRLADVRITDERFDRPDDFDLQGYWDAWCSKRERRRPRYVVVLLVAPGLLPAVKRHFGDSMSEQIIEAGPPDNHGWAQLTVAFESLHHARVRVLGLGGAAEVLEPQPLRRSVADFARQAVALYERRATE